MANNNPGKGKKTPAKKTPAAPYNPPSRLFQAEEGLPADVITGRDIAFRGATDDAPDPDLVVRQGLEKFFQKKTILSKDNQDPYDAKTGKKLSENKGASRLNWDKADLGKLQGLVPYLSNIANAFRKPPMPAKPITEAGITTSRVSLDGSRQNIKDQVRTAALSAEATLPANAAAAAKVGAMGEGIRALNTVSEKEALINAEQRDKQTTTNAAISGTNNQRTGAYNDSLVDRDIAHRREQSANLANATDKFVMQKDEVTRRSDDMNKLRILKEAFNYQGVGDRTLAMLRQIPELKGLFANGGELPGVPPKGTRVPGITPAVADAHAKSFATRRGLLTGEYTHTGGVVPKVTMDGREVPFGAPILNPTPSYAPVPKDVRDFYYAADGKPYWENAQTGDQVALDPSLINTPQFRKPAAQQQQPLVAKRAMGGRLLKPLYPKL